MKVKARQITIMEMVTVLRRFFVLILACTLLCGAAGYYSVRSTPVTYTATSAVYVHTVDVDMDAGMTSSQISVSRARALECQDAIKADAVYTNMRSYFAERRLDDPDGGWEDLTDVRTETLRAMITCTVESSSQYAQISVTAPTASLAVHMANAAAAVLEVSVAGSVISNCHIEPVQVARSATASASSSLTTVVLFAMIGAIASYVLLFVLHFFDPRVRGEEELCEAYGETLPLLGSVPAAKQEKGERVS